MEYQKVSKSVIKAIKQLLEYTSKDQARDNLFYKVEVKGETAVAADGFKLAYLKLNDELKNVFGEDGVYIVHDGRIFNEPVVAVEKKEVNYPDLDHVMPKGNVVLRFGINPHLLMSALKHANINQAVEFIVYEYKDMNPAESVTNPIEMRFSVADNEFDAIIMPMFSPYSKWSVKGENK